MTFSPATSSLETTLMKSSADKLLDLVNNSGFLFQLGVEAEAQSTYDQHGWKTVVHEYPWQQSNGSGGFIDLILWKNNIRLVIECKRVREATWAFLALTDQEETRFRSAWANCVQGESPLAGWFDFRMGPSSPVAEFCIVRGQGENDRPLLERVCGGLVQSVDSLAEEELRIAAKRPIGFTTIYIPVIVTNAELQLCVYSPTRISMVDGTIPDAVFQTVPFIRFTKSLATSLSSAPDVEDFRSALRDRERTVFIVSASSLVEFLRKLAVGGPHDTFSSYPWMKARQKG
jgi:hypothetical protein